MSQSQPLRIENSKVGSFGTCKSLNSRLWFVNNQELEERILGYLAKYQEKHNVPVYGFTIQGNHFHLLAKFPNENRGNFYRDLNARSAEAVRYLVPRFPGGPLFRSRYSEQALPLDADIEDRFFYCALQPVYAGLTERISDYPGYNSFSDAISGIEKEYKVVDWGKYNAKKRYSKHVSIEDFTTYHTLKFQRLPGYESLSQREYRKLMLKKLEEKRVRIVNELKRQGKQFMTKEQLKAVRPGSLPFSTKKSDRYSYRPLVLSRCQEAKKAYLEWYFSIYDIYKKASKKYCQGIFDVEFPPGTYKPPGPLIT